MPNISNESQEQAQQQIQECEHYQRQQQQQHNRHKSKRHGRNRQVQRPQPSNKSVKTSSPEDTLAQHTNAKVNKKEMVIISGDSIVKNIIGPKAYPGAQYRSD